MFSSAKPSFTAKSPFKSRMAGDAFDSDDPVAKGTGEYVKARSSSFADSADQRLASAEVSPEKANSYGVKGDSADGIESMPKTEDSGMSAKEAGFRNANEQRLGTEEYNRLSGSGLQDADSKGRYSAKEVIAEMRDGRDGKSTEEMAAYYQGLADDGTKFNKRAQDFLREKHGVYFGNKGGDAETGGGGGAGGNNEGGVTDTEGQHAQARTDRFKIKGKGAYVHQPRDYDAISSGIANRALARADQRDLAELEELQKSVDRNPLYWKARSDVQTGDYLGDIWNFDVGEFKMPKPLNPVESPDLAGMADDWTKKIGSIKPEL